MFVQKFGLLLVALLQLVLPSLFPFAVVLLTLIPRFVDLVGHKSLQTLVAVYCFLLVVIVVVEQIHFVIVPLGCQILVQFFETPDHIPFLLVFVLCQTVHQLVVPQLPLGLIAPSFAHFAALVFLPLTSYLYLPCPLPVTVYLNLVIPAAVKK